MTAAKGGIGGFIGFEPPAAGGGRPFETSHLHFFQTARAALAHLLAAAGAGRVWLPAYICAEVLQAARAADCDVVFYGVGADLALRTETLERRLRPGDAVLGVDYFAAAPDPALAALAARRRDVTWIQDRAQCLWPADRAWGDHLIYSPRKVIGVPDGGVLVSLGRQIREPDWREPQDTGATAAALARFEDAQGERNEDWFGAYRASEGRLGTEPRPMSRFSRALLPALDTHAAAERRRANAALLLQQVGGHALMAADRLLEGTPLGVPVLTEDAGAASRRMAESGVYCARHWAELPSPAADFPDEHALSRRLLTLPCDHRYGPDEMARVAAAFLACVR